MQLIPVGLALAQNASNNADAKVEARQLEDQGNEEAAIAQRRATRERRRGERILSRARAIMAASGGGLDNLNAENIEGDLEDDIRFNTLSALYEGSNRQNTRRFQSTQTRSRARSQAASNIATAGAQTLYNKYS